MALHLDHCTEREDVFLALELPFDSIMVDASSEDPEENAKFVASIVEKAKERNISIEAEMGRIQGGEDGLPTVDLEALYTEPEFAADFISKTGVHFLAPSFGNIHGIYPPGGPAKYWQLDRLDKIHKENPSVPLVLHGVPHDFDDELMKKAISLGIRKVNFNRNLHDPYLEFLSQNIGKLEMTALQKGSLAAFAAEAKRCIELLGGANKA
ncbi:hypothetical protein AWJ20_2856 [Sugiyamaella lignohabitans]|uniref:Fructose-bisphosphate aldolase n=1 Tax=Sugiyamaella lignohabitans TaxID=796027 RepID=A0A161HH54_9ASCO|nr:uncharacterized protein AWJ20_2856 [Sugiyamaella lignohabitans]ANB15230.1 hypothetical protein AWJ20_2856 [Sugiyamaella lignohabitans]